MPRHVGPVAFTLDGVTYEIDLSTKNANKLLTLVYYGLRDGRFRAVAHRQVAA